MRRRSSSVCVRKPRELHRVSRWPKRVTELARTCPMARLSTAPIACSPDCQADTRLSTASIACSPDCQADTRLSTASIACSPDCQADTRLSTASIAC